MKIKKYIIILFIYLSAIILGFLISKANSEKYKLKKDNDAIHRICRSHLEETIPGKPCYVCRLKWNEINQSKTMQDKIVEYAEKKYCKKLVEFTDSELTETIRMMIQ